MHPFTLVIEVFEGERRHLQWLTPLTIGYLYTLTGVWWHFALTVFAIGGARFSTDLEKKVRDGDATYSELVKSGFDIPVLRGVIIIIFGLPYVFAIVYAPYLLSLKFDHANLLLVGLAAVYLGVLIIVIQKLSFPEI